MRAWDSTSRADSAEVAAQSEGTVLAVMVREGETELSDIWFGMWYYRLAAERGTPLSDAEKAEVRKNYPPPAHIDFRSITK